MSMQIQPVRGVGGVVNPGGSGGGCGVRKYHQQQHSQIGTVSHLLAGGIAGAVSKTCTAPFARLTILFQLQGMHSDGKTLSKASIWKEASRIVSHEGYRAFWKGNLVTITHRLPYSSISFYSYERYKKYLETVPGLESHRKSAGADISVKLVSGGLSGITAASLTYPLDLVRTRLAAQLTTTSFYWVKVIGSWPNRWRGMWHALQTISREEAAFGLYKGLGATLLGVGPSLAISFAVYETLRASWQSLRPQDSTIAISLACGSISGIASSTAIFPLDLVRRRMQVEGAGGTATVYKTGLFGTLGHIMRTEGLSGLYRGILPEYYKVVPGVGIAFMTYETIKMFLSKSTCADVV